MKVRLIYVVVHIPGMSSRRHYLIPEDGSAPSPDVVETFINLLTADMKKWPRFTADKILYDVSTESPVNTTVSGATCTEIRGFHAIQRSLASFDATLCPVARQKETVDYQLQLGNKTKNISGKTASILVDGDG
jgi:hypothetical protein